MPLRHTLMALGIVLIWGMNFVVMKHGLQDFTPLQLVAARFALASLPLLAFVRRPQLPWRFWVGYGLLQGVGQFGLLFTALHVGMTAALASVLMQMQVFFTALFGWVFLREALSRVQRVAMVFAALALMCFVMASVESSAGVRAVTVAGFVFNLGAAAMWAGANIVTRKAQAANPQFDALGLVVWSCVPAVPVLLLLSWVLDGSAAQSRWLTAGWAGWGAAAYLAALATVVAYVMWTKLLQSYAANRVAPFSLGVPVVGLTAGMVLLNEQVGAWQWAGIGCVALALAVTLFGSTWLTRRPA